MYNNAVYSDVTVIFNCKEFYLQLEYIIKYSEYFECISKKNYKEQNIINITWMSINKAKINPLYFDNIMKLLYNHKENMDIEDVSLYINNNELTELLEYYKLMDYFKINNEILNIVKKMIFNLFINIGYTEFKTHSYVNNQRAMLRKLSYPYDSSCTSYSAYLSGSIDIKSEICENSIGSELVKIYEVDDNFTIRYANYMLRIFGDRDIRFKRKIFGICNYDFNDINIIEKEYNMLALGSLVFNMDYLNTKINSN
jgi:hypothetical protein